MYDLLAIAPFPIVMLAAGISDLRSMEIPNRLSIGLVVAFVIVGMLVGVPLATIGLHAVAAALIFTVGFALFAANVMGGGDVKLLTACALWFGLTPALMSFLITTAMAGGILTLTLIALRSMPIFQAAATRCSLPPHLADRTAGIPYGIAIAIGGIVCYPQTEIAQWAIARLST